MSEIFSIIMMKNVQIKRPLKRLTNQKFLMRKKQKSFTTKAVMYANFLADVLLQVSFALRIAAL